MMTVAISKHTSSREAATDPAPAGWDGDCSRFLTFDGSGWDKPHRRSAKG